MSKPSPAPPDPDLCVVGAGPAGIALAREMLDSGLTVVVLESGASQPDPRQQALNDGPVRGDPFAALVATRSRRLGGSAAVWNTAVRGGIGAKFMPLDPIDFAGDPARPETAWPFGADALAPFYERAQALCGLGPFRYDGAAWAAADTPLGGAPLVTRVYQFGLAKPFTETYPADVAGSSAMTLRTRTTVRRLVLADGHVVRVDAAEVDGSPVTLRPRAVVLAAGAIENARLLLVSADGGGTAPGNRHGWVGRGFMEHPRDRSLVLTPKRRGIGRRMAFYDRHTAPDGTTLAGRIAPDPDWLAATGLPNFTLSILPGLRASRLPWALRFGLQRIGWPLQPTGFGWTAGRAGRGRPVLDAVLHVEQRPHPDNRVLLDSERDRFGVPRPALEWRWRATDQAGLDGAREAARRWLESTGLFDVAVVPRPLDPNAHHHAGTTRFHADPALGVADPDGRVHGTDNLFVAGASLLPAAGVANPTLTIVALAIRLADHLKSAFGTGATSPPRNSDMERRSRSR